MLHVSKPFPHQGKIYVNRLVQGTALSCLARIRKWSNDLSCSELWVESEYNHEIILSSAEDTCSHAPSGVSLSRHFNAGVTIVILFWFPLTSKLLRKRRPLEPSLLSKRNIFCNHFLFLFFVFWLLMPNYCWMFNYTFFILYFAINTTLVGPFLCVQSLSKWRPNHHRWF